MATRPRRKKARSLIDSAPFLEMGSCYCTEYAADQRDSYLYPFPVNVRKGGVVAVVTVQQMHTSGAKNSAATRAGRRCAVIEID